MHSHGSLGQSREGVIHGSHPLLLIGYHPLLLGGIDADFAFADSVAHLPKDALLRGVIVPHALVDRGYPGSLGELLGERGEEVGRFELTAPPLPLLLLADGAVDLALVAAVGLLLDLVREP